MAKTILVLGLSGSGKSRSLLNLPPEETFIINADRKELPFRGAEKNYPAHIISAERPGWNGNNVYENRFPYILMKLREKPQAFNKYKYVVFDTISNAMLKSVIDRNNEKGYEKFVDYANEVYSLIDLAPTLPCKFLIVFGHVEKEEDFERFKVPAGKLTNEKITPESHFTIVLFSRSRKVSDDNVEYFFETRTDGQNTCKSPEGMFPAMRIPNDMAYVMKCINAYHDGAETPPLPEGFTASSTDKENF